MWTLMFLTFYTFVVFFVTNLNYSLNGQSDKIIEAIS